MNQGEPYILLAEDDENDIFFLRRALQKAQVELPLHIVRNGQEALDFLSGSSASLVLLDLKMPFVDGFEVLEWIRSQPSLKDLPVAVLTSSPEERDRQKAGTLGARGYFVKPPTPEMIKDFLRFLTEPKTDAGVSA